MYMNEIHNELIAYYSGTYATYDGSVYHIKDIMMPEPDGTNDYDDPYYNNDGGFEVEEVMDRFNVYVEQQIPSLDFEDASGEHSEMSLGLFDFSFPDMGLINIQAHYDVDGNKTAFNMAKNMARRTQRQWRRALRHDALEVNHAYSGLIPMLEAVTGKEHYENRARVSPSTLVALYFPQYESVQYALEELEHTIGTYALSKDWWVGQGKHGIVFGNGYNMCGEVTDGKFSFDNDDLLFLKESLIEVIGVERYES